LFAGDRFGWKVAHYLPVVIFVPISFLLGISAVALSRGRCVLGWIGIFCSTLQTAVIVKFLGDISSNM
jgi:hypothetical protein